jgi:Protein of unknown function (DUF2934)
MATRRLSDAVNPPDSAPPADSGRTARGRKSPPANPPRASLTPEARRALIAEAAYLRAERRGFAPGQENDDWLAAEAEVDALLTVGQRSKQ